MIKNTLWFTFLLLFFYFGTTKSNQNIVKDLFFKEIFQQTIFPFYLSIYLLRIFKIFKEENKKLIENEKSDNNV
jgi:hypothetical protein